ncbi:Ferredoxin-6 [Zhongshania aliphaticivorans]|uniref:Ferredoxin-6 n=1 Tax=Zhongshania aliphaticivorans TaxID=1470434 RepID=A0A5S9NQ13_9GAMM|nr:2Fe-2S iron-sulfur cluster-binding protein [Zhongshania aliphaticivorans]CAA0092519.1 Ferredoxin-6 [Zhongshania aliphaticivorans]CAA0109805.1 Ferredoxin-6 [Zhongshania aliphaticivorans]
MSENKNTIEMTFIESSGIKKVVEAKIGDSLMSVAKNNMVEGVDADCGGCCACGTCRIYMDENNPALFGEADEMEAAMLDFAAEGDSSQRLSCQIIVSENFAGAEIKIVV